MQISYIDPLSRAWDKMKKALFQPFNISKWFAVGFTAFLAALLNGGGGGNGGQHYTNSSYHDGFDNFFNFPNQAMEWINSHPVIFIFIIIGVVFLFALGIVLTWLSSRGKFMFIDNVVHDKAEVVNPWNNYKKEGDSLFIWRLIFGIISFAAIVFFVIAAFLVIRDMYFDQIPMAQNIFSIIAIALSFIVLMAVISIISLFLNDFVVPIMYKYRISTSQAWLKFMQVLSRNIGHFIVYVLFIIVLTIAVVIGIVVFGFATLCIGFILLSLPYIGSVVLLPVTYTYRAFSIEFLEQFGEEYKIFPETDDVPLITQE